jgi:hypothetical protein
MSEIYKNLEGSGARSMAENESALQKAEAELAELRIRAGQGEIVDDEVKRVNALIQKLREDKGLISAGGV